MSSYQSAVTTAVVNGNLDDLRSLDVLRSEHKLDNVGWNDGVYLTAIQFGQLECLRYAVENECPRLCSIMCLYAHAALYGQLQCLEYLFEVYPPPINKYNNYDRIIRAALIGGHLPILQHVHQNCPQLELDAYYSRDAITNLDCIKYIHTNTGILPEYLCNWASERGCIDVLKYAHDHGCSLSDMSHVFEINCLRYIFEHGGVWTNKTMAHLVYEGELSSIKYAHQNGCPLRTGLYDMLESGYSDRGTTDCFVVKHDNIYDNYNACFDYLRHHDCPVDQDEYDSALYQFTN